MIRKIPLILALVALIAALGCATGGTRLTQVWKDPAYGGDTIEKVLVLGVAKTDARRRIFENKMSAMFGERNVEAVPSWQVIPAGKEIDKDAVRDAIEGRGFDAVLVTRLIKVDKETKYVPGYTYVDSYWGSPHYSSFYPYYTSSYAVVHEPGYTYEDTVVSVETNIYDVATENLMFAAVSETLNPDNVNDAIDTFGKTIVGELINQDLVR